MKKAKQTLTAALAATLATGALGTVAGASPLDDTFASTLKLVEKAQSEKTQTSINEARVAINAMPKELDWAKGEFSKQVDKVQQPLYTQIVDLIEKGKKEAKQETINEGRKLLVGVEDAYAKTWSTDFDTIQQKLVNDATEAVKAAKSQKPEDIKKATDLVAELKTSTNEDTKKEAEKLEKQLVETVNVYAVNVTIENASTLIVEFSKDVEESSVSKEDFVLTSGQYKAHVTKAEVKEKNKVKLTLGANLDENKEYKLTVDGIRDAKGNKGNKSELVVKYDKAEVASAKFNSTKVLRGVELLKDKYVTIMDEKGRDVTKEAKKITFECPEDSSLVSKDGKISSSAKLNKEYTIRIYSNGSLLHTDTIKVVDKLEKELVGVTLAKITDDKVKYSEISPNTKVQLSKSSPMTIFFTDTLGNEKHVLQDASGVKITSADKTVVVNSDNTLRGVKVGTAVIRIQYGEIDQTVEVEVTKDAIADYDLTIDDVFLANANVRVAAVTGLTNKSTSAEEGIPEGSKVYLYDSVKGDYSKNAFTVVGSDGIVWLNGANLGKGDFKARLELPKDYGSKTIDFNINVKNPDKIANYVVEARNNDGSVIDEIDVNVSKADVDHQANFVVFAIDANGNRVAQISNFDIAKMYINNELATTVENSINSSNVDRIINKDGKRLVSEYNTIAFEVLSPTGRQMTDTISLNVKNSYAKTTQLYVSNRAVVGSDIKDCLRVSYGNLHENSDAVVSLDYYVVKTGKVLENDKFTGEGEISIYVRSVVTDRNSQPLPINDYITINVGPKVNTDKQDYEAQLVTLQKQEESAEYEVYKAEQKVNTTSASVMTLQNKYDAALDKNSKTPSPDTARELAAAEKELNAEKEALAKQEKDLEATQKTLAGIQKDIKFVKSMLGIK